MLKQTQEIPHKGDELLQEKRSRLKKIQDLHLEYN